LGRVSKAQPSEALPLDCDRSSGASFRPLLPARAQENDTENPRSHLDFLDDEHGEVHLRVVVVDDHVDPPQVRFPAKDFRRVLRVSRRRAR
jgi:hypothetical protein